MHTFNGHLMLRHLVLSPYSEEKNVDCTRLETFNQLYY